MNIVFSKSALADLKNIQEYYLEQGVPNIGQKLVTTIIERIEVLKQHPDSGRIVPEIGDVSIRELIHNSFRIVYLREVEMIKVIRIWRSERLLKLTDD